MKNLFYDESHVHLCELVCYLWFGPQRYCPPSSSFILYTHHVLISTQLTRPTAILALHYIYLLKSMNPTLPPAQRGSEYRVVLAALMLANKFLDDNTYTNRTWADVSGIRLDEVNRMESEFLKGCGFKMYVDEQMYERWVKAVGRADSFVRGKENIGRKRSGRAEEHSERMHRKPYARPSRQHTAATSPFTKLSIQSPAPAGLIAGEIPKPIYAPRAIYASSHQHI